MTKALAKRTSSSNIVILIGIALIAGLFYLIMKSRPVSGGNQYTNKEEWSISYDSDGLPTRIVISRDARRS